MVWIRVSKGQDVLLSLCPGTKKFSCLDVPLTQDKGSSKNPGTKSLYQKEVLKQEKYVLKQKKYVLKKEKML